MGVSGRNGVLGCNCEDEVTYKLQLQNPTTTAQRLPSDWMIEAITSSARRISSDVTREDTRVPLIEGSSRLRNSAPARACTKEFMHRCDATTTTKRARHVNTHSNHNGGTSITGGMKTTDLHLYTREYTTSSPHSQRRGLQSSVNKRRTSLFKALFSHTSRSIVRSYPLRYRLPSGCRPAGLA